MVTLSNDRLLLLFLLFPTKTSDCLYVSTYRTFQSRVIFVRCDKSHERWACRGDVLLHKALLTVHSCGKENEQITGMFWIVCRVRERTPVNGETNKPLIHVPMYLLNANFRKFFAAACLSNLNDDLSSDRIWLYFRIWANPITMI